MMFYEPAFGKNGFAACGNHLYFLNIEEQKILQFGIKRSKQTIWQTAFDA